MLRAPVARSVSVYHLRSNRESAPMTTASFPEQVRPVYQYVMKDGLPQEGNVLWNRH